MLCKNGSTCPRPTLSAAANAEAKSSSENAKEHWSISEPGMLFVSELPVNFPYEGSEKLLMVQDGRTKAGFLSAFTAYLSDELLADSELSALSGVWQSTYTTVSANSAIWQSSGVVYDDSALQAASGSWDSTYTNRSSGVTSATN